MRKQTKLVAVMSAAALLAIGASMTSFAATRGWVEENGVWMYLDSDGDAVTEEWKKSGTQYFWLDENGEMATDALIEDEDDRYYVDANGARVLNQWRQVDNEDGWTTQDDDEEPEQVWYYFGTNGKAFKDAKKTINGKTYFFDEDGEMFYGWYDHAKDGKSYYLGEDNEGWAYTGWQWLELQEDIVDDYDDDEYWFHFKTNGEMRVGKATEDKRQYINGAYYGFDENGVMVDGWRPAPDKATDKATAARATENKFYTEDMGNQPKGWVFTYTYEDWDDQVDDEEWFYLDSKGKPFNVGGYYKNNNKSTAKAIKYKEGDVVDKHYSSDDRYNEIAAKYIKKETYLFGNDGVMLSGVIKILNGTVASDDDYSGKGAPRDGGSSGELKPGIYYFNKNDGSNKGQMETGKISINYDGETYHYNFKKGDGRAYVNAIVDGCLYDADGVRLDADESKEVIDLASENFGDKIVDKNGDTIIDLSTWAGPAEVVVSSSGKVKKSGTVTIDGEKITVAGKDSAGVQYPDYIVSERESK